MLQDKVLLCITFPSQEEAIQRRLNTCKGELEFAEQPNSYNYTIVNDDLDNAYTQLKDIINNEMNATI